MSKQLPERARLSLDAIHRKLMACIRSHATTQNSARSHFMKYGDAIGGPMLESEPNIEHPYHELLEMYEAMFASAEEDGMELREVETRFERNGWSEWTHETRWVTVREYADLEKAAEPVVERIRRQLRQIATDTAAEWESISFETKQGVPFQVIVRSERGKDELPPAAPLVSCVAEISAAARDLGLAFADGSWDVDSDMEDEEGEIDSTIAVI